MIRELVEQLPIFEQSKNGNMQMKFLSSPAKKWNLLHRKIKFSWTKMRPFPVILCSSRSNFVVRKNAWSTEWPTDGWTDLHIYKRINNLEFFLNANNLNYCIKAATITTTTITSKGSYRSKKKIVKVWMMMNRKEELLPFAAAPLTRPPCPARSITHSLAC